MKQLMSIVFSMVLLMMGQWVFAQKSKPAQIREGAGDRAFWVKALHKVAWPVVENLANGTLEKICPWRKDQNTTLTPARFLTWKPWGVVLQV
ncbi:hypothetical protein [Niabella hibiscisoli]|uniref:hypothetical protein n=1 Tax=Niabella hibiscisoli TaxID=1825928 RepID=UPI001F0F8117|nr:hypothetical protein [Niabella hibiscisoli]MCH5716142.1 hypothetical protein [Niabella hibiscisoli]